MTEDSLSLLHGYIYEISNGSQRPVAFASISVSEAGRAPVSRRMTGADGSYSFPLFSGMYTIRVEKPGFIPQGAFVILEANDTVRIDFYLEKSNAPYEAQVIIEGLPPGVYPKLFLDGIFHGWVLNGSGFLFAKNLSHTVELGEISEDGVRYVLASGRTQTFVEAETKVFRYSRQFYVNSSTDPWRDGWYDEGSVIFESTPIIDLGNASRLVFDIWIVDGKILDENPVKIEVNSSFQIDTKYRRQYFLQLSSDRSEVIGGGWYDEGSTAKISVRETTVGALPFKYIFAGWRGDLESNNTLAEVLVDGPKNIHAEWLRSEVLRIEKLDPIYKAIIDISLLISAATILSGLFAKIHLPEVLGELSAGMILGPYALGGIKVLNEPLVEISEYLIIFAEVGAILLLFVAGLEVSFGKFRAVVAKSSVVGIFGVVAPFFLGLHVLGLSGYTWNASLLVAAALTATSIAITLRTLESAGRLNSIEGNIMINAAVIDDVLGLVVLAVVMSIVASGAAFQPYDAMWILFRTVIFWLMLLAATLAVAPRVVRAAEWWRARGTVEVAATATCFGSAVAAAAIGLSPIVGAYAAGMAIASSRVIARIRDYIERLSMLFSPIFFAVIGAQFNISALSWQGTWIIAVLIAVAVVSKLVGCGLPAAIALRNSKSGLRVGVGMISRGEIGLIIAGLGVTSGIIDQTLYGAVIAMVIFTTLVTPLALRWVYA
ncbi:cation:proton antiporter [Candidatus Bathyarchaeota archaeon]|nr:cation:proton antiporter [Candidatus Bathyarchaeota archaeon]